MYFEFEYIGVHISQEIAEKVGGMYTPLNHRAKVQKDPLCNKLHTYDIHNQTLCAHGIHQYPQSIIGQDFIFLSLLW